MRVNVHRERNEPARVSGYKNSKGAISPSRHLAGDGRCVHLDALSIEVKTLSPPVEIKEHARVNCACCVGVNTIGSPNTGSMRTGGERQSWKHPGKRRPPFDCLPVESKHKRSKSAPLLEFIPTGPSYLPVSRASERDQVRIVRTGIRELSFVFTLGCAPTNRTFVTDSGWIRGRKQVR